MSIEFNIFSLILLVSAIVVIGISSVIIFRFTDSVKWFAFSMLAVSIWALAYSFELSSSTLEAMLFWIKIEYVGISMAPGIFVWFCLKYAGKEKWLNTGSFLIIFSVPIVTFLMVLTNEYHHLHYQEVSLDLSGPFPLLKITRGPWYIVHVFFFYGTLFLGNFFLLRRFGHGDPVFRKQVYLLFLAGIFPWVINVLYMAGFRPLGQIDLTPYAFLFTYIIVGFGLLRYGLFNIKPLARDRIIAAMTKGILVIDPLDRIIDYNPAMKCMLGKNAQNLIGKKLEEVFESQPLIYSNNKLKDSKTIELKLSCEGESEFAVDFIPLLDKQGITNGMLLQFTDISKEKAVQNQLKTQAEELQTMNVLKDKLFTIISHDLKGPIFGIRELIHLTENGVISNKEFFEVLPEISKQISSVSMLLENLLAWSSSQLKGEFLEKKVFDISLTIDQQIALFHKKSTEKGLTLQLQKDRNLEVYADKNMIDLVLRNLISNAIKFSGNQDSITISTCDLGEKVEIIILDTGTGISPENLEKLNSGESFTTLGRQAETGTGLGILLVRDYILKNGGKLIIESTLGKGSKFSFSLPKN